MFDWMKKHIGWIVIGVLILLFGVPLAIHILFKLHAPIPFFEAEWTAGDALGYYGAILSFVGTSVLGILALYQNHIIKEESDKHTKMLEQRELDMHKPAFSAESVYSNENCAKLTMKITNISQNLASCITVCEITIVSQEGEPFWQCEKTFKFDFIKAGQDVQLDLKNPGLKKAGYIFSMKLSCQDKFELDHLYQIRGRNSGSSNPSFKVTEIK